MARTPRQRPCGMLTERVRRANLAKIRRMSVPAPSFDETHAAFMQSGVSVHVASRGPANVPSVARALGCRIAPDRSRVTIFVSAAQAPDLVRDLRASRMAAAVFSRPSTHETIQIKGSDATVGALADGDLARVAAYAEALVRDLQALGYTESFGRALVDCDPADLVAVAFTAEGRVPADSRPRCGRAARALNAMPACVDSIRECLEGAVPSIVATCDPDGTPNASYASQVHYVDGQHVALSYQFFNKTRQNILANPRATAAGDRPVHRRPLCAGARLPAHRDVRPAVREHEGEARRHRLAHRHERRVQAAGCRHLPRAGDPPGRGDAAARPAAGAQPARGGARGWAADRAAAPSSRRSSTPRCRRSTPSSTFGHAMILMADAPGERLYTVASRGYPASGVGSEIPFGHGVIGVAARERTPIRINHMTTEYAYGRAIRESALASGLGDRLETEIPLPGLPASRSQLAVPIARRRPPRRHALRREPAGPPVRLRRRGRAGGDRHAARPGDAAPAGGGGARRGAAGASARRADHRDRRSPCGTTRRTTACSSATTT